MIKKYIRIVAFLSCFPLMATDPTKKSPTLTAPQHDPHDALMRLSQKQGPSLADFAGVDDDITPTFVQGKSPSIKDVKTASEITSPTHADLSNHVEWIQYPVAKQKNPAASGYNAVLNSLLALKLITEKETALEMEILLKDPEIGQELFGKMDSPMRADTIENRKNVMAIDYGKDTLLLNIKGAKEIGYQDIASFDFSRLFLKEAVVVFESDNQDEVHALVALLPAVAEKLMSKRVKKSETEYQYAITRDAFIQAVKDEAAAKAKKNTSKVYVALQQKETIEKHFPKLHGIEFTLKSSVNENAIQGSDSETGNVTDFKRTYGPAKNAEASDLPELAPASDSKDESAEESEKMDGDWLSASDVTHLIKIAKDEPLEIYESDALEDASVQCLESSKKSSFLAELELEMRGKQLVKDLEGAPTSSAILPINCDGEWISCVVHKKKDKVRFVVTDPKNKDRRHEPAIEKLATTVEESFKKQKKVSKDEKPSKSTDDPLAGLLNTPAKEKKSEDQEEKVNYDAPLARFTLEELPSLKQLFGGEIPNTIKVPLYQLRAGTEQFQMLGTKIKRALMLYGPPGTGKSTIAQVLAREAGIKSENILFISGGAFRNAYQGSSKAIMDALFAEALKKNEPCVIIIDEIDGTTSKLEPHSSTQEDNRAVKVLITTLDQHRHNPNIFVICTTNNPEKIDPAILRRFLKIEIGLPNYKMRKQILEHYFERTGIEIKEDDPDSVSPKFFEALVCATNGFSGDALEDLVNTSVLHSQLGLAPERTNIGMGFWFKGIDTGKPLSKNLTGMFENPYVPLVYWLGGYQHSEFDKQLYSHYKRLQEVRADIEERERQANDPNAKTMNQSWRQKVKAALLSAASSMWHGIFTGIGSDIWKDKVRPPMEKAWEKVKPF